MEFIEADGDSHEKPLRTAAPDYIEAACDSHRNLLRHLRAAAAGKLCVGAVAFGERHDAPNARAVILDLIEGGFVRKLFLEAPDLSMKLVTGDGTGYVSAYFHEKAASRADLKGDSVWKSFKQLSGRFFRRVPNRIDLYKVIKVAVANGVLVHFYDRLSEKRPDSPPAMMRRNASMGEIFKANAKADEAGVALLVGVSHLHPAPSGGVFDHTLQAQCGIGLYQVIDLSLLKLSERRELSKS
jgi:hypothetical protein